MTEVKVVINEAAVREFLAAPDGPVGRHMMTAAEAVKRRTLELMNPTVRRLMGDRMVKRPVMTPSGMAVQVGVAKTRTRPHPIDPHPPLRFLRFKAKDGTVVYVRHVDHPGSEMGPYIEKLLARAVEVTRV